MNRLESVKHVRLPPICSHKDIINIEQDHKDGDYHIIEGSRITTIYGGNSISVAPASICSYSLGRNCILVGLSSGELWKVDPQLELVANVALGQVGEPVRSIYSLDDQMLFLLGSSTILCVYNEALERAFGGDYNLIRDSACLYRMDAGRIENARFLLDASIQGWPLGRGELPNRIKIVTVGQNPMVALHSLTPISEALPDPMAVAADFFSGTVGGWLRGKSHPPPKPKPMSSLASEGMAEQLVTLDDSDRLISHIFPASNGDYLLFDAKHGRLLRFNPHEGLITAQMKGLRGFYVAPVGEQTLLAFNPKRAIIQSISVDDLSLQPIETPAAERIRLLPSGLILTSDESTEPLNLYRLINE